MISLTNTEEYRALLGVLRTPWFYVISALFCAWAALSGGEFPISLCFLSVVLVAMSFVDFNHKIVPDVLLVPATLAGLFLTHLPMQLAVLGGLVGFILFAAIFWGSYHLTGRHGLGFGDVKLLAMIGVWAGPLGLPLVLLIATFFAAFVAIYFLLKGQRNQQIPFAPFLAAGCWVVVLYGEYLWLYIHTKLGVLGF